MTVRHSTRDSARLFVGHIAIVGTSTCRAAEHLRRAAAAAAAVAARKKEDAGRAKRLGNNGDSGCDRWADSHC